MSAENHFGPILRCLRTAKGLSQEGLAAKLEISRAHIGRLENGQKQPSLKMLFRLAEALETQASEIIAEMEKETGNSPS